MGKTKVPSTNYTINRNTHTHIHIGSVEEVHGRG